VSTFYEETLYLWNDFAEVITPIDRESLQTLILFILQNCTFEFNDCLYRQNYGTTMGARFSVKFANIYMHMWFRRFLNSYDGAKPTFIGRLIDDCFFTWNHSETDLLAFLNYLYGCHSTIKFEHHYSTDKVNFLDTVIYKEAGVLKSTIYIKPTDEKQYLNFSSCHPRHIFQSIPYSQAIRYRRIVELRRQHSSEFLARLEK
jgi:hypothetical protein